MKIKISAALARVLGKHLLKILKLREEDGKTFKEIGRIIGRTGVRAQQMYCQAKRLQEHERTEPFWGLSVRTRNCISNLAIESRAQLLAAIQDGRLQKRRNFGTVSYIEVLEWLGLEVPESMRRKARPKVRMYAESSAPTDPFAWLETPRAEALKRANDTGR
jgi:DNA-directed RNA polymerase alpha subunit